MKFKKIKVLPSLLAADFSNLNNEIIKIEKTNMYIHHIDIMDGHFVDNISFGTVVLDSIYKIATKGMDIHFMVKNPSDQIINFFKYNPSIMTIHSELQDEEIKKTYSIINKVNKKIKKGLAINPNTIIDERIINLFKIVDVVLVMSVIPGKGGQNFIKETYNKIKYIKKIVKEYNLNICIEIDGGIDNNSYYEAVKCGAEMLVAGSFIYKSNCYFEAINSLREI